MSKEVVSYVFSVPGGVGAVLFAMEERGWNVVWKYWTPGEAVRCNRTVPIFPFTGMIKPDEKEAECPLQAQGDHGQSDTKPGEAPAVPLSSVAARVDLAV